MAERHPLLFSDNESNPFRSGMLNPLNMWLTRRGVAGKMPINISSEVKNETEVYLGFRTGRRAWWTGPSGTALQGRVHRGSKTPQRQVPASSPERERCRTRRWAFFISAKAMTGLVGREKPGAPSHADERGGGEACAGDKVIESGVMVEAPYLARSEPHPVAARLKPQGA
jgi:hypothetical protein